MWILKCSILLLVIIGALGRHPNSASADDCSQLPRTIKNEIKSYRGIASRIIKEIVTGKYSGVTYNRWVLSVSRLSRLTSSPVYRLAAMTDKFGPRMSGSQALEDAIDYIRDEMTADGLKAHTETAEIPIWKRGEERARLIEPRHIDLPMLGLGSSVGTNSTELIADVIVVESFEEFELIPSSEVTGKIVVFAQKFVSYGETVQYRAKGASVAARKGAFAALINSVTPNSMRNPHTGHQSYDHDVKKIPAACITGEDAAMLVRFYQRGVPIKIGLTMAAENLGTGQSRNLIGELIGREKVNESVVVVSGHLDSWDVGVGAMDDGGGAFIARFATTFLAQMGLRPRRTIRTILWTAEEQGYVGALAYMNQHKAAEKEEFNFFIESDMGTFEPLGLDFSGNALAKCIFDEVVLLLEPLNATQTTSPQDAGPDISVWTDRGFPGASLMNQNDKYFWYHHSAADSMLVESSENLDKGAAAFAVAAYVIADLSIDIPKDVK